MKRNQAASVVDAAVPKRQARRAGMLCGLMLAALALGLAGCVDNTEQGKSADSKTASVAKQESDSQSDGQSVPWDYRLVSGTVGDLIGSDMTLLPDNVLLPNDNNYATGDKVWTLQFMSAELASDDEQRASVKLSGWDTLKSYKDESQAKQDLENLKVRVATEVGVVGVYKTAYRKETREFAVLELPSGNRVKQPIDDARYRKLEKAKTAKVVLEEIHDFDDYDAAYAKFRGWAD
jgi:hypothetical protein